MCRRMTSANRDKGRPYGQTGSVGARALAAEQRLDRRENANRDQSNPASLKSANVDIGVDGTAGFRAKTREGTRRSPSLLPTRSDERPVRKYSAAGLCWDSRLGQGDWRTHVRRPRERPTVVPARAEMSRPSTGGLHLKPTATQIETKTLSRWGVPGESLAQVTQENAAPRRPVNVFRDPAAANRLDPD